MKCMSLQKILTFSHELIAWMYTVVRLLSFYKTLLFDIISVYGHLFLCIVLKPYYECFFLFSLLATLVYEDLTDSFFPEITDFFVIVLIVASFKPNILPRNVEPSPFRRRSKISILVSKEIALPFYLTFFFRDTDNI